MNDDQALPFEDKIRFMTVTELGGYVDNWLWEGPLHLTPNKGQASRLIAMIASRQDVAECTDILNSCKEYLDLFYASRPTIEPGPLASCDRLKP
jgi:hypothetical protein